MNDERMDPRFRAAVRDELERLPARSAQHPQPHRPWFAAVVTVVVAALVIGVSLLVLRVAPHPVPASPSPTASVSPSPNPTIRTTAFGPVVAVLAAPALGNLVVSAASDDALYIATASENDGRSWTIRRIDVATGATVSRTLHLEYLYRLVVGPDGLYVSTNVIERFPNTGDTLLRMDLRSLKTLAETHPAVHADFDSGLDLVATSDSLLMTTGGGELVRMDPRTLVIEGSVSLLTRAQLLDGEILSAPVPSGDHVWVLTHDGLVVTGSTTLVVERRISYSGALKADGQDVSPVVLDGELVLLGKEVVRVPSEGDPIRLASVPDLEAAFPAPVFADLAAARLEPAGRVTLTLIGADGRVRATQAMDPGDGSIIAASPKLLWVQGLPGHPTELAAIRVAVSR